MLRVQQTGSFHQRISSLSKSLRGSSKKWQGMAVELKAGSRQVMFAKGDFKVAKDGAYWASHDNGRTDSSWHGSRIEGGFQDGARDLDWAESLVRRSDRKLDGLQDELALSDSDLDQLVRDMASAGDARLPLLEQAATKLNAAESSFGEMGPEFDEFRDGSRQVDRHVRWSRSDIEEVVRDRPGFNVSGAARRIQKQIQKIDGELDDLESGLHSSRQSGAQGEEYLIATISHLERALDTDETV